MRFVFIALLLVGCSGSSTPPPPLSPYQQEVNRVARCISTDYCPPRTEYDIRRAWMATDGIVYDEEPSL